MLQIAGGLTHLCRFKAALFALPTAFLAIEITTGQAVVATVLAFLSAILAAWLAARPGMVRERSTRQQRQEERHIQWLQARINYHSQVVVLVRQSKHDALNYIDELHAHINKLRERIKECGGEAPPFEFKYYDELCGEEDRAMVKLTIPSEIHDSKVNGQ